MASNRGPVAFRLGDDGVAAHRPAAAAGWCPAVSGGDRARARSGSARRSRDADRTRRRRGPRRPPRRGRPRHRRRRGADAADRRDDVPPRLQRRRQLRRSGTSTTRCSTPRGPPRSTRRWMLLLAGLRRLQHARSPRRSPRRRRHGAQVLVQDYHLMLAPAAAARTAARRADRALHAHPVGRAVVLLASCPTTSREAVLHGMLGADTVGLPLPPVGGVVRATARSGCSGRTPAANTVHVGGRSTRDQRASARGRRRTSCARARPSRTSVPGGRRCCGGRATAGSSSGSTAPSCRRTSSAACSPTASCCATTPNIAGASSTWSSPTPPGTTCPTTAPTRPTCSAWRARSTTSSPPTAGHRWCSRSTTTTRARSPRCSSPRSSSSTRCATG